LLWPASTKYRVNLFSTIKGQSIPGAEDATYTVAAKDIGRVITVRVTAIFADETRMTVTTTPAA
jgi:hypothetical protein